MSLSFNPGIVIMDGSHMTEPIGSIFNLLDNTFDFLVLQILKRHLIWWTVQKNVFILSPLHAQNTISYVSSFIQTRLAFNSRILMICIGFRLLLELFSSYDQLNMLLLNVFGTHWKYPNL